MRETAWINRKPESEADHQANVIAWAEIHMDKYPELAMLHHIPNGGSRDVREAARLKKQGVKSGVPDLCLPVARGKYHGLYIEMKKSTGGRVEDAQKKWGEWLTDQGYLWQVCRGWQSAVQLLQWYLELKEGRQ